MKILCYILLSLALVLMPCSSIRGGIWFNQLDKRQGFSESRIRDILLLTDGRIAVATSSTLDIFDGTHVARYDIPPVPTITLTHYHGYRRLMEDTEGRVWLKNSGTLHVVDTRKNMVLENLKNLPRQVADVYVSPKGAPCFVDTAGYLTTGGRRVANLQQSGTGIPEQMVVGGSRILMCFESGRVCVLDLYSGAIVMNSSPFSTHPATSSSDTSADSLWAGIRTCLHDGKLWVSHNYKDYERPGLITCLDTLTRQWLPTLTTGSRISDFCFHNDTLWVAGRHGLERYDKNLLLIDRHTLFPVVGEENPQQFQIDNILFENYGGIWLGTHENGLLYHHPTRGKIVTTTDKTYPYPLTGRYCSPRAERLAHAFADGITNCSAEDSLGRAFIGTRDGLLVISADDHLLCRLDHHDGLADENVQSVLVAAGGDVWLTTSTGITRIHSVSGDSMQIAHFGLLDGLQLKGGEFLPERIHQDSAGTLFFGFSAGTCQLLPEEASAPRFTFAYPRPHEDDCDESGSVKDGGSVKWWLVAIMVVLTAALLPLMLKRRKRLAPPPPSPQQMARDYIMMAGQQNVIAGQDDTVAPSADQLFLQKLRLTVEQNVGRGEDLTVQTLSELMAMDRTGLYRRMQLLTGMSPSAYIKEVCMTLAARMLKETNLSVTDVATRTGFSSAKYFSTTFKSVYGISPSAYREK